MKYEKDFNICNSIDVLFMMDKLSKYINIQEVIEEWKILTRHVRIFMRVIKMNAVNMVLIGRIFNQNNQSSHWLCPWESNTLRSLDLSNVNLILFLLNIWMNQNKCGEVFLSYIKKGTSFHIMVKFKDIKFEF